MPESVDHRFDHVRVPLYWAGYTTGDGPFLCGACPRDGSCETAGRCQRASEDDFKVGLRQMRNALTF